MFYVSTDRFILFDFAQLRIPFHELRIPAAAIDSLNIHFPSFSIGSISSTKKSLYILMNVWLQISRCVSLSRAFFLIVRNDMPCRFFSDVGVVLYLMFGLTFSFIVASPLIYFEPQFLSLFLKRTNLPVSLTFCSENSSSFSRLIGSNIYFFITVSFYGPPTPSLVSLKSTIINKSGKRIIFLITNL